VDLEVGGSELNIIGCQSHPTFPRSHRAMTEPDCKLCRGIRWVCEEHPDQPWGHDGCRGAGMPCPLCTTRPAGRTSHQRRYGASRPPSTGSTAERRGGGGLPSARSLRLFQQRLALAERPRWCAWAARPGFACGPCRDAAADL